jgi:high-affinity Fe2+/Pb2+ permease
MTPRYIVENTFAPSQFAATATTAIAVGATSNGGGKTLLILFAILILIAAGYALWQYHEDQKSE